MSEHARHGATQLDLELGRVRLLLARHLVWLDARGAGAGGGDAAAEAAFHADNPAAAALGERIAEVEERLAAGADGPETPLDGLVRRLNLTNLDRSLLLLAAGRELDPAIQRGCALAHGDPGRPFASPALAAALFGEAPAVRERLAPAMPLRRLRLVGLGETDRFGWSSGRLSMDERVVMHLLGIDMVEGRVAALLQRFDEPPAAGDDARIADRIASVLPARGWPRVHLKGPSHAGGRAIAAAVATQLGLGLAAFPSDSVAQLAADPGLVGLVDREAALLEFAVLLEDGSPGTVSVAARLAAPCLIVGPEPLALADALVVAARPPDRPGQLAAWKADLPGAAVGVIEPLVAQFDLGLHQIRSAVRAARSAAMLRGAAEPELDELWDACREQARLDTDGLGRPISTKAPWDSLVLPADALVQLDEITAQARFRPRVEDEWGFRGRLARGRGISALFSGPSGTGKTMAAEVIAARLRLDLYRIDLAAVLSKWIGETEKNLARLFDAAERSGAVLFFDEADALFGKRAEIKDARDRYANLEVDYLLQRMEDYAGVAILATNRKNLLDPAFLRRLRFVIDFPFPDGDARMRLWAGAFPREAPVRSLDLEQLARLELSGGSIKTIAVNAAFLAASDGGVIRMDHVMHAARREYAKLDRLIAPADFGAWA